MHHGGQRDAVEHGGERVAVGDVAGRDLGVRAQVAQARQQLERAVGVGAAAREQQQLADAVLTHEVLGHERAEAARAACDQHGAGAEGHGTVGRVDAFQPRRAQRSVAQRELRLVGQQDLGRVVEIEQPEAAGMLGLRAAHEPPDGGAGEVGRLPDGAAGDEHEPRGGERVVRQPLAQQRERGVHGVVGLAGGGGDEHRFRRSASTSSASSA